MIACAEPPGMAAIIRPGAGSDTDLDPADSLGLVCSEEATAADAHAAEPLAFPDRPQGSAPGITEPVLAVQPERGNVGPHGAPERRLDQDLETAVTETSNLLACGLRRALARQAGHPHNR